MKSVAIYSIKGGVGKTASAVNLAYLSSKDGYRTLLWDLDPQSSATFYLRVTPKVKGGGRRLLKKKGDLDAAVRGTDFEGFDLLPGDLSYRKFDLVLEDVDNAGKRVARLFERLEATYDHIILDCSPGFSLLSEALLHVVDVVLVPIIPTPLSMRSLELIADYFDRRGLSRGKLRPFFSMVDRRKSLHRALIESPPFQALRFSSSAIPYASQVEQMGTHRSPLHCYAAGSVPALAFDHLWAELLADLQEVERG